MITFQAVSGYVTEVYIGGRFVGAITKDHAGTWSLQTTVPVLQTDAEWRSWAEAEAAVARIYEEEDRRP